jgi:hypothetical protein
MTVSTSYKDKAYINGKWVAASSGKTFQVTSEYPSRRFRRRLGTPATSKRKGES